MADEKTKSTQRNLEESAHRIWLAGLGALALAEQEGGRMFESLVERGTDWETRGKERVKEARAKVGSTVEGVEDRIDEKIAAAMRRFGVPSRDEVQELTRRVEELNAKIARMNAGGGPGPGAGPDPGPGPGPGFDPGPGA